MIRIEGGFDVDQRAPGDVFDFMVDFRNERLWNKMNRSPELVGDGAIGIGTRFRCVNDKMGPLVVEVTEYHRPDTFAYRITGKMGEMRFCARFGAGAGGTHVLTENELRPRGIFRLMSPLIGAMMRKQIPPHQAELKRYLESAAR